MPSTDLERRFLDEGVVLAVLSALAAPAAPGLQERILWHEPVRAVVPASHPFAGRGAIPLDELVHEPLVVTGVAGGRVPEVLELLARRGMVAAATATAHCPATVAALVQAGIGIGLLTEVAARTVVEADGAARDLLAVPVADPGLVRRVGVYWYDALLGTDLGRRLLREVLAAQPPPGAVPLAASGPPVADPPPTGVEGRVGDGEGLAVDVGLVDVGLVDVGLVEFSAGVLRDGVTVR